MYCPPPSSSARSADLRISPAHSQGPSPNCLDSATWARCQGVVCQRVLNSQSGRLEQKMMSWGPVKRVIPSKEPIISCSMILMEALITATPRTCPPSPVRTG